MIASVYDFIAAPGFSKTELPLFGCAVPAGFPSPADDHFDGPFDLTHHLFRNPASTFLARTSGDSMTGAGIHPGDLVAVDRRSACPPRQYRGGRSRRRAYPQAPAAAGRAALAGGRKYPLPAAAHRPRGGPDGGGSGDARYSFAR